jgi:exosortase/archaeosortase family protein
MLMVFFALSTTVAILIQAPLWERLLIVASALPIALIANIMRITVTGILYQFLDKELVNTIFHDYLGLGMMIVAMLLLWGEVWLLSRLFVAEEDRPMVAGLGVAGAARGR